MTEKQTNIEVLKVVAMLQITLNKLDDLELSPWFEPIYARELKYVGKRFKKAIEKYVGLGFNGASLIELDQLQDVINYLEALIDEAIGFEEKDVEMLEVRQGDVDMEQGEV